MGAICIVFLLSQFVSLALCTQTSCDIKYDVILAGRVAYCIGRNRTSVPQDLGHIVGLHLNGNITSTKLVFVSYPALKILTLYINRIDVLNKDTFLGLNHLVELHMMNTTYIDNGSYPQGIFDALRNLQILSLAGDIRDRFVFPCFLFLPLTKLIVLSLYEVPWHNLEKCEELGNLRNLKSLKTATKSSSNLLRNDSFTYLEFVPLQNLTVGGISHLTENCAFCPLKRLTYLKIASSIFDNDITLHRATLFLYALLHQKSYINNIDFNGLQDKESYKIDTILDRQVMGYLPEICVKRLDLWNNRLMAINSNTFQESDMFTKCIEHLDLSRNYITFDINLYLHIPLMMNLKVLDLSQNGDRFLPHFDSYHARCPQYEGKQINLGTRNELNIAFPPKLEQLNLSKISKYIDCDSTVTFSNEGNLRVLDLSNNGMLLIRAKVQGLSNISYLDISGMDIIEETFNNSDMFTNVEKLVARQINRFDLFHISMSKYLDFVLTMTKLKHLDLSGNRLSYIPLESLRMPTLTYLDLSSNSINIIRKEERELLDKKYEKQGRFYLNIYGNNIVCTCHTLDFVQWLHETKISLGNKGNYSCLTDYGTMTYTTNFYNDILLHWRQCVGQFWLTVAVSLQLVIIKCLMSAFLLKKYFPKVEYQILRWLGKLDPKRWDYEYDAYICYEDKEYQWPCLCLYKELLERDEKINLYLPDLHDPFGEVKAEVIHAAIKMSWKLIIVVTEDLFADEWSYFKVLEALRLFSQEGVITNRIILLYQNMSPEDEARVPKVLLNVVPRKNILQVIPGNDFWMDLRCMIVTEDMNMDILF